MAGRPSRLTPNTPMQQGNPHAMKRCGAKTRGGKPCDSWAMPNGRCRMHGGKTPVAGALPQTTHGRYSKYLPARLAGRYQEAQADADLLALRDEVSLIDSRLADLLKRVDTHEAGHWWKELRQAHNEYQSAEKKADIPAMRHWINEWGRIAQVGLTDYAAWNEVYNVLEQRRKLVESERKRLVEMQQVITSERAMLLIAALVDVIKQHVSDRNTLAAISADVGKLITVDGS